MNIKHHVFLVFCSDANAKWILNILWQMQGIDVHFDTNIGKWLSALGSTLTVLAGQPDYTIEEDGLKGDAEDDYDDDDDMQSLQVCGYLTLTW